MTAPSAGRLRVMVCAITAAATASRAQNGPPPALVRLDEVRMETVAEHREVTGELRAVRRSRLAAEESGMVVELTVEVGDSVKEGQVLAKLDSLLLEIELGRTNAELRSHEAVIEQHAAALEKAERDLARIEEARNRGGASETELSDARTALQAARARVAEAQAGLMMVQAMQEHLRERIEDMKVRAPFAGRVVVKSTERGEWVNRGDPIVELVQLDELDAWIDVPEEFIGAVEARAGAGAEGESGARLQIRVPAVNRVIEAESFVIVPSGDSLARTFPIRARLENKEGMLQPRMSVVGVVPTGRSEQAMTVHKDAVLRNDAGPFVYYDGGGHAAVAPIEIMFAVGDRLVIRSPVLRPGAMAVIEGNERMFPGQPLIMAGGRQGVPEAVDGRSGGEVKRRS